MTKALNHKSTDGTGKIYPPAPPSLQKQTSLNTPNHSQRNNISVLTPNNMNQSINSIPMMQMNSPAVLNQSNGLNNSIVLNQSDVNPIAPTATNPVPTSTQVQGIITHAL